MGKLVGAFLMPHPPVIVKEVGKGQEHAAKKTILAATNVAKKISELKPKTIIVTTPHGVSFSDYIYISKHDNMRGDFKNFNCESVQLKFNCDNDLVLKIVRLANERHIPVVTWDNELLSGRNIDNKLDHGSLVPLYFVKKELANFDIVHISIADLSMKQMYTFGTIINEAINQLGNDVVFVASGDLSHKVNNESPYGYSKYGKEFDDLVINSLKDKRIEDILNINENFCYNAAQCGIKSLAIMLGALDKYEFYVKINSYEAPFGIGYAVASFLNLK